MEGNSVGTRRFSHREYARMAAQSLDELAKSCEAEAFRAHGPGGQGVNTTDSAVRMCHLPTGIVTVSRESRSQYRNRQLCLRKIRDELERRAIPPVVRKETKPTRSSQERRLEHKRQRAQTKALRGRVHEEE